MDYSRVRGDNTTRLPECTVAGQCLSIFPITRCLQCRTSGRISRAMLVIQSLGQRLEDGEFASRDQLERAAFEGTPEKDIISSGLPERR